MFGANRNRLVLRAALVALAGAVALLALAGCGSTGKPAVHSDTSRSTARTGGGAATVTIKNFSFSPGTLTVKAATTVTVINKDAVTHTLTAAAKSTFDTGDIAAGKTVTFRAPTNPGAHPYICEIHQYMHGTLTVS
ncbi:MAG: cupredoxin domain-containing protein [Jatrophihabitantaceae bacterium]